LATLQDQQSLWEEEKASLKHMLKTASEARDIRSHDQDGAGEAIKVLRTRILELEADAVEQGKRIKHLESHLREREKLLVKADKRYQELVR
jgi:chromosome segregation ATPase